MKARRNGNWVWGLIAAAFLVAAARSPVQAEVVNFGQTFEITGPNDLDLDLTGNIIGVNVDSIVNRPVGSMVFLSEANALTYHGITISGALVGQGIPEFGATADDNHFERVFDRGRHAQPQINIPVIPGHQYKIQLLAHENLAAAGRGMDIWIEGALAVDEMPVVLNDGNHQAVFAGNSATLYTHTLTATDNNLDINLLSSSTFVDNNPFFQALTIEDLSAPSLIFSKRIGTFTGGDHGDGLRVQGDFEYAVNVRGPGGLQVGNALFTLDTAPGVTVTAENNILNWINPNYGGTANDNNLETVMQSMRWTNTGNGGIEILGVDLAGIIPGQQYELQLLFGDNPGNRGFNILLEGLLVAGNFSPNAFQFGNTSVGVVVTTRFLAPDDTLNIILDGLGVPFGDNNPILNGFTLERIPEPTTLTLLGLGGLGMVMRRRRRKTMKKRRSGLMAAIALGALLCGVAPTTEAGPIVDASLKLWLDASTIAGLNNGDPVSTWVDQSGAGNNATSAGAARPMYVSNVLGGKPVVRFDATNDTMATPLSLSGADTYTVFAVFDYNSAAGAARRAIQGTNNWLIGPYNNQVLHHTQVGGWVTNPGPPVTQFQFYVAEATNDGTSSQFRVDGIGQTTNGASTGRPGTIHLGGGGAFPGELLDGDIAEVLIYNRALGAHEREQVGRYLEIKYGLSTSYGTANKALGAAIIDGSSAYNFAAFNTGVYNAFRVTDGKQGDTSGQTFWLGTDGDVTEYLTLDLGQPTDIQTISLRNTHNGAGNDRGTRDFQIWASNAVVGGSNQLISPNMILQAKLTTSMGPNGDTMIPTDTFNELNGLATGTYRYLRFNTLSASFAPAGQNHVGLNEIEVFDHFRPGDVAAGKPIIKSSGELGGFPVGNVTNQMIDDFDAGGIRSFWLGREFTANEFFTIDLGGHFLVNRIELQNTHNRGWNDRGTADFEIWAALGVDGNNDLVSPQLILAGTLANRAGTGFDIPFDVFDTLNGDFPVFPARYIQFVALTYYQSATNGSSGLNEMRIFAVTPEPTTLTLLGLGALALLRRRRRTR